MSRFMVASTKWLGYRDIVGFIIIVGASGRVANTSYLACMTGILPIVPMHTHQFSHSRYIAKAVQEVRVGAKGSVIEWVKSWHTSCKVLKFIDEQPQE